MRDSFVKEKNLLIISSAFGLVYLFSYTEFGFTPLDTLLLILLLLNSYYLFKTVLKLSQLKDVNGITYISPTAIYFSLFVGFATLGFITNKMLNIEFLWDLNKVYSIMLLALGEVIASSISTGIENTAYIRTNDESLKKFLPRVPFEVKNSFIMFFIAILLLLLITIGAYFFINQELKSYWYILFILPFFTHSMVLIFYFLFKDDEVIEFNKNILQEHDRHIVLNQVCKKLANKNSKYCRKTNTSQYQTILHYLNNKQNPNEVFENKYTMLLPSACCGDYKLVKLLIEHGSDVNFKNSLGTCALHLAVKNGFYEIAKLLIDNGAEIDVKDLDGKTPLMLAIENGYVEIATILNEANKQKKDIDS